VAELGIKGPLEYLQVYATTLISLLFIYMIPIACKITNFPYTYTLIKQSMVGPYMGKGLGCIETTSNLHCTVDSVYL